MAEAARVVVLESNISYRSSAVGRSAGFPFVHSWNKSTKNLKLSNSLSASSSFLEDFDLEDSSNDPNSSKSPDNRGLLPFCSKGHVTLNSNPLKWL